MFAAMDGYLKTVEALISIGKADVNVKDNQGRTALMHAAEDGKRDSAKALLDTGIADINDKGDNGRTALVEAVINEHEDIVELFLGTGKIDVDSEDQFGTAFDYANLHGPLTIANLLQSYSASSQ
ncbi:ankyrin repeat-containing domain protein [Bipolaris maydis]|uniref:ankyrin repeat-containing domain protein n=1 Tax=Cochliobolus heterostrophus TaxID=5016 RepID=UPI0024DD639F|nr:ankyrin repeat-containing domain protein [Bipolaris maydis]KAJ6272332.1 ankyrin repeat-containing domain protein [Bipolaris maydis]